MRPGCGRELTTRSDGVELPPFDTALKLLPLLDAEAELDTWRIVEAFSLTPAPFDLELAWAAGAGSGAFAKVTVARSARICLFARALKIRAGNLADKTNRVCVTVADGRTTTRNQWEVRGNANEQQPEVIEIPPFATHLRLDMADPTQLPGADIKVYDGLGTLRANVAGNAQPGAGVPVGGAGKVEVTVTGASDYRVVFTLAL